MEEYKKYLWIGILAIVLIVISYLFLKEIIKKIVEKIFDFLYKCVPKMILFIIHMIVKAFKGTLYFIKVFFIALKICIFGA